MTGSWPSSSSAPGILDPRSHYARQGGSTGVSDAERKMQLMMAMASSTSNDEEDEEAEDQFSETLEGHVGQSGHAASTSSLRPERPGPSNAHPPAPLSTLPIEIVERIITYAMQPDADHVSQVAGTDDAMRANIALGRAAQLCLVSQQFDALARPIMYRRIRVSHRKTRAFLRALEGKNKRLATYVRDLTLDSRIWTSDVNEDTIARILVAVRRHVIRLQVGANESVLLPYLFHGHPRSPVGSSDTAGESTLEPAALQALHVCWRDEVDFDPERRRPRRQNRAAGNGAAEEADGLAADEDLSESDVETDDDAVRDSLRSLFEHDYGERSREASRDRAAGHTATALKNLQHLTLDLVTHAQLAQLFLSSGYFVQHVLPQLQLLRIELPLAVLQFACPLRGALAHQWPCKRWRLHTRNIEDMLGDRIEQNRSVNVDYAVQQQRRQSDPRSEPDTTPQAEVSMSSDVAAQPTGSPGDVVLAACADYQLKALLQRYALNVHKNDTTLFEVLLAPTRALGEKTWSSRSAISAYCLKATLEKRLNSATTAMTLREGPVTAQTKSDPFIVFSLASFMARGVPQFWRTQWEEADEVYAAYLPATTGGTQIAAEAATLAASMPSAGKDTLARRQQQLKGEQSLTSKPHVAILLKWPTAQEAFFHHSAMV